LSGCGGGGTDASAGGGGKSSESVYGDLVTNGFVTSDPVTANSYYAQFIGVVGSFNAVSIRDLKPDLRNSRIAWTTGNTSIYTVEPNGENETLVVTDANGYPTSLRFNASANRIYYSANALARWVPSGGGSYTSFLSPARTTSLDFNPDYNKLVRTDLDGSYTNLWTSAIGGGSPVQITSSNVTKYNAEWVNANTVGYDDGARITLLNADGSNARDLTSTTGTMTRLRGSADGHWVTFIWRKPSTSRDLVGVGYMTLWGVVNSPIGIDLGVNATSAAFSPDGSRIVATTSDQMMYTMKLDGSDLQSVPAVGDHLGMANVEWGSMMSNVDLVGTNGNYGASCSGLVFSQSGTETNSVVMFTANPATSAKIASDSQNTTGPNVVYTVEADKLTKLSFAESASYTMQPVTLKANSNGLLLSFDSETGKLATAVSYHVTRGSKPTVTQTAGATTIEGDMDSVFDATGKDLGPATKVVISASGEVTITH
jgi:hypothetical protein